MALMDYTGDSTARRSADDLVAVSHMGKAWEVCALTKTHSNIRYKNPIKAFAHL